MMKLRFHGRTRYRGRQKAYRIHFEGEMRAEYQRFGRSGTTSGPKSGPKSGTRRQSTALLAEFKHRSMFRTTMPINPANAPAAA